MITLCRNADDVSFAYRNFFKRKITERTRLHRPRLTVLIGERDDGTCGSAVGRDDFAADRRIGGGRRSQLERADVRTVAVFGILKKSLGRISPR